jgi:phage portal protein BeeE
MSNFGQWITRDSSVENRSMENPRQPLDPWATVASAGEIDLSSSGVRVSREKALTVAAVWRANALVSDTVAKLPLLSWRYQHPGRVVEPNCAAYRLLHVSPNSLMTPFTFKQTLTSHVLLEGNGYAYIFRRESGYPVELV